MNAAGSSGSEVWGSACLIVARNLGDAVIQSLFFRSLVARGFARRYVVWSRPQVAFLFKDIAGCEVVTSQFPVGTNKQFDFRAAVEMSRAVRALRKMRLDVTIDLIGDFRERILSRMAGSRRHLGIGWAEGHPFAEIIRNPFGTGTPAFVVPVSYANVYDAHRAFASALFGRADDGIEPTASAHLRAPGSPPRIGLHPFASQDCKLWPADRWYELAEALQAAGAQLSAYGAPAERGRLEAMFGKVSQPVRLVTGSIPAFADDVAGLDLMIGLDSFSVHVAEARGVRSLMLNACNHPTLWIPPHGATVSDSGGCPAYPCMNVPVCKGTAGEYVCIHSVSVGSVLDRVRAADARLLS